MSDERAKTIEHVHLVASRPVWGAIAILATIIISGGTAWLSSVSAEQLAVQKKIEVLKDAHFASESRQARVETTLDSLAKSQARIEGKVDQLSDRIDRALGARDR